MRSVVAGLNDSSFHSHPHRWFYSRSPSSVALFTVTLLGGFIHSHTLLGGFIHGQPSRWLYSRSTSSVALFTVTLLGGFIHGHPPRWLYSRSPSSVVLFKLTLLGGFIHCHSPRWLYSRSPFSVVFSGLRVTRSLVLCVCFVDRCLSFCPFSFGHCVAVLLRFKHSDYPFGIFKLIFQCFLCTGYLGHIH